MTPCFLGADPAVSPLLGPEPLRPLGGAEDLARELMCSLGPAAAAQATLLNRAPSDIIGGNRPHVGDGDEMIRLPDLWEQPFTEPELATSIAELDAGTRPRPNGAGDHRRLALTTVPKGLRRPGTRRRAAAPAAHAAGLPISGGSPAACHRSGPTTTTPPWTPCTWPGPAPCAGPAALLPAAGPGAADRVRQRSAARQPRAFGMARPGVRLRHDVLAATGRRTTADRAEPARRLPMAAPYRSAASRAGR